MILFLTEQGAKVSKEGRRLCIELGRGRKEEVHLSQLEQVMVFGRVHFTASALQTLLKQNIDLHFFTLSGNYLGKLSPPLGKNVELRLAQFSAFREAGKRLALAKAFVRGKLRNQARYLSRQKSKLGEPTLEGPVYRLRLFLKELDSASEVENLLGIEGSASKAYFEGLGVVLKSSGFEFPGRVKRPPTDPVNALLSLGYALLTARLWGLVESAGLDPYLGYLHSPDYGKPSLVLDLMEEWRPVLVDSVVVRVLNWGVLKPEDFTREVFQDEAELGEVQPVKLTRAGLKKFVKQFQNRLREKVFYPLRKKRYPYQEILREQVYLLARVLQGLASEYQPFEME